MSKTSSKLNPQRIAIAISAGIGILACFMPWTSFPIVGTVNGASGDGLIYAGLLVIPLLFVLLGDKTKKLEKQVKVANILVGILVIFCGIFVEIANFDYKIKTAEQVSNRRISNSSYINKGDAENISNAMIEFGLYLLIISSISVVVCSGVDSLFQNSTDKKKINK